MQSPFKKAAWSGENSWRKQYAIILIICFCLYFLPNFMLENYNLDLDFETHNASANVIAARWIHYMLAFSVFEIVCVYTIVFGHIIRRKLLSRSDRILAYGVEFAVLIFYFALKLSLNFGGTIPGSAILGTFTMSSALSRYEIYAVHRSADAFLNQMEWTSTFSAIIAIASVISSFAIITSIQRWTG